MAITASNLLCAITIVLYATTLSSIGCHGEQEQYSKQEQDHKMLFVFGDSLFDAGNNQYLPNARPSAYTSWPYGIDLHNKSTGRVSNGFVVPDFIALFAKLKVAPPSLKPEADFTDGANFASAGAAVLGQNSVAINLQDQLTNFAKLRNSLAKKVGEQEAKKILMRSVYLFSFGGNDYFRFNTIHPKPTQSEMISYMLMVIGNLTNGFKEIYAMGGRKFAIQNVGPLGCMPTTKQNNYLTLRGGCAQNFLIHATLHNKALSKALEKFAINLPGFKYSIHDYYHTLLDRINNAPKYGFKEGKIACCGNGIYNGKNCGSTTEDFNLCPNRKEYVFFDGSHTTQTANEQLAQLLWSGVPNITGPYNVQQLFKLP